MKKLFYLVALSTLFLVACTEAEHPIPENKIIERPTFESEPIEIPVYSNDKEEMTK